MSSYPITWGSPQVAEGTCYKILLWTQNAIAESKLSLWREQRSLILAEMRDAGIKGSRGKLAQFAAQLRELSEELIYKSLEAINADESSHTRIGALAPALREAAKRREGLLAYSYGAEHIELLLELTGEAGLDEQIAPWLASCPEIIWNKERLIEAINAMDAHEFQLSCQADLIAESFIEVEDEDEEDDESEQSSSNFHHVTVLAHEASAALLAAPGKQVIDATLGGGGHAERLLLQGASVIGIDQDPAARKAAKKRLSAFGEQLKVIAGNFNGITDLLHSQGYESVDGILADIGISSPQVDCAERGFSFMSEGPLDMRMNPQASLTAADIVNKESEQAIADILWQYGEERASRAIARRIVQEREKAPITTTTALAEIIAKVMPRKGKQNPATRSFQALRIAVNDELGALNALMEQGIGLLKPGGRMAIITFHSLEDRAVKRYFEKLCKAEVDRPEWPEARPNPDYCAKQITRKPIIASEEELKANPRARSAKLRVIEKI